MRVNYNPTRECFPLHISCVRRNEGEKREEVRPPQSSTLTHLGTQTEERGRLIDTARCCALLPESLRLIKNDNANPSEVFIVSERGLGCYGLKNNTWPLPHWHFSSTEAPLQCPTLVDHANITLSVCWHHWQASVAFSFWNAYMLTSSNCVVFFFAQSSVVWEDSIWC